MDNNTGKYIIIFGCVIIVAGIIIYYFYNKLNWIGNLPGDIKIVRENFRLYFPFTSMLILSILVTLILWVWRRFQ